MTGDRLRTTKLVLSGAAMLLGLASIVTTFTSGGSITSVGVFLGAILMAMGGIRIYLTLRHDF